MAIGAALGYFLGSGDTSKKDATNDLTDDKKKANTKKDADKPAE